MYQVPQFIQYETKIVGPMSARQAVFVVGAIAIIFALYFTLAEKSFLLFLILATPIGILAISFAFLRLYGRAFGEIIFSVAGFVFGARTYVWRKGKQKPQQTSPTPASPEPDRAQKKTSEEKGSLIGGERSRLRRLGWKVGFQKSSEEE